MMRRTARVHPRPLECRRQLETGFTLIELLLVLVVIAVLAALLFPVFSRAREQARTARCLSNLRQISIATMLYAQDYDETLPRDVTACRDGARTDPCSQSYPGSRIEAKIRPYVQNVGVFECPSATTPLVYWDQERAVCARDGLGYPDFICVPGEPMHGKPLSYGWNASLFQLCVVPWHGLCEAPGIPLAAVTAPADRVMVADSRASYLDPFLLAFANYPGESAFWADNVGTFWPEFAQRPHPGPTIVPARDARHRMGQNVAFLDGHARWVLYQAFTGASTARVIETWFD